MHCPPTFITGNNNKMREETPNPSLQRKGALRLNKWVTYIVHAVTAHTKRDTWFAVNFTAILACLITICPLSAVI